MSVWHAWGRWRRSRPFWGGLLVIAGGAEILATTAASLGVTLRVAPAGTGTFAGTMITMILVVSGLLLWFNPAQRVFYSIVAVILSLATFNTINLGGFFAGMLLGILGGALGFAWTRDPSQAGERPGEPSRPGERRVEPSRLDELLPGEPQPDSPQAGSPQPDSPQAGSPRPGSPQARSPQPGSPQPGRPHAGEPPPGQAARPLESSWPGRGAPGRLSLAALPLVLLIAAAPAQLQAHSPAVQSRAVQSQAVQSRAMRSRAASSLARSPTVGALVVAAVPSELTAGAAKLSGLAYRGVVSVPRAAGSPLQMMKFTFSSATLTGRPRLAVHGADGTAVITASTISFTGHVVLYTTKFSAGLAGTRVTVTPGSPPALITRLLGGLVTGRLAAGGIVADHPLALAGTADLAGLTLSAH